MACEDYPCCGHEWGDCEGLLYGSDEDIRRHAVAAMMEEDGLYHEEWEEADHPTSGDCVLAGNLSLPSRTMVWECDECGRELPEYGQEVPA